MENQVQLEFKGSGPERLFKEKLAAGRFEIQKCRACDRHFFYPRVLCPHCGSAEVEWVVSSGRAVVYATTVVRRKPEEGGDHNVAIVELDEGPRLMTRVEGVVPEQVKIGQTVRAQINGTGDAAVLVFVPGAAAEKK